MGDWPLALLVGGIVGMGVAPIVLVFAWFPMRRRSEKDEVTPQQRMAVLRNTAFAIVVVVLVTATGFVLLKKDAPPADATGMSSAMGGMQPAGMPGASSTGAVLPSRLAGLPLSQALTGDQALQQVAAIHSSQIPVASAVVGFYQGGGHQATVWVAFTSAPEMAGAMTGQMAQAIAAGDTPFGTPQQMADGVWRLEGMGQIHYFFHVGNGVWWVSADKELASRSLAQTETAAGL